MPVVTFTAEDEAALFLELEGSVPSMPIFTAKDEAELALLLELEESVSVPAISVVKIAEASVYIKPPQTYKKLAEMNVDVNSQQLCVQTEYPYRHFLIFDDTEHFAQYSKRIPQEQRCFHEIITANPRRFVIDIDDDDIEPSTYKQVGDKCVATFITVFNEYYSQQVHIDNDDVIVISACGPSANKKKSKFSCQIRLDYTISARENQAFAQFYSERLECPVKVDLGVYKNLQFMRIVGSTKKDDGRHSRILSGHKIDDVWVGRNFWFPTLPEKLLPVIKNDAPSYDVETREILESVKTHTIGYSFRERSGNMMLFDRSSWPKQCPNCIRQHDKDNALYLVCRPDGVYQGCFHTKGLIKIVTMAIAPQKEIVSKSAEEIYTQLLNEPVKKTAPNVLGKQTYSAEKMQSYTHANTLLVHAGKGLGKTEALAKYINDNFADLPVVALTHRETFASELTKQLPGFVSYKDLEMNKISLQTTKKVIIQMESMHRLNIPEIMRDSLGVGLLILDESESLLTQLSSRLFKKFNESWAVFNWLTKYSNNVIALDANMTFRTVNLLADRPGTRAYVRNTFTKQSKKYFITPKVDVWYNQLWSDLGAGKKVVIASNSARECKGIARVVAEKYPAKLIKLYTGETDRAEKSENISNISAAWKCDVLIYSPTITAGVSFKEKNFDRIYGFFRVGSANAAECDQMLGRVRDIADNCGYIYIDPINTEPYISRKCIENQVLTVRNNLLAKYDITNLCFQYTKTGTDVKNREYFDIWLDNCVNVNKSRANLARELIQLFKSDGLAVELLQTSNFAGNMKELVKNAKKQIAQDSFVTIAAAKDICAADAHNISDNMNATVEERAQLTKHKLGVFYGINEPLTAEWVELYNSSESMNWFRNLKDITTLSLEEIQKNDNKKIDDTANSWNQKINFERHRIVTELLKITGFSSVKDKKIVKKSEILSGIQAYAAKLTEQFDHSRATFKFRGAMPNFATDDLKKILEHINVMLSSQYGIKIQQLSRKNSERDQYVLSHKHAFDQNNFSAKNPSGNVLVIADDSDLVELII